MGRKPKPSKNPSLNKSRPGPGLKKSNASGGVVLGKKMLGRKREADIQRKDPKLQMRITVKIVKDARIDGLGLKVKSGLGNKQRKKQPVLKSSAPRPRSVTIYKAKKRVQQTRTTSNSKTTTSRNTRQPIPHGKPPAFSLKAPGKNLRKTPGVKRQSGRKATAITLKKGGNQAKAKAPLKSAKRKPLSKSPKQHPIPNPKPGRAKGKARKRGGAKGNEDDGSGIIKKLRLSVPKDQFLLTLVRHIDITLHRNARIEELAGALKPVNPPLPPLLQSNSKSNPIDESDPEPNALPPAQTQNESLELSDAEEGRSIPVGELDSSFGRQDQESGNEEDEDEAQVESRPLSDKLGLGQMMITEDETGIYTRVSPTSSSATDEEGTQNGQVQHPLLALDPHGGNQAEMMEEDLEGWLDGYEDAGEAPTQVLTLAEGVEMELEDFEQVDEEDEANGNLGSIAEEDEDGQEEEEEDKKEEESMGLAFPINYGNQIRNALTAKQNGTTN